MVHCSVYGCKNRSERCKENVTFHRFPKDKSICEQWIDAVGKQNWQPTQWTCICSKHFEANCLKKVNRVTIVRNGAVPKLFIHKPKSPYTCKCCLTKHKKLSRLKNMWQDHSMDEIQEVYGSMLIECFGLPWSTPENPECSLDLICEKCIARLKDAVAFKAEVLASEQQLLTEPPDSENIEKIKQDYDDVDMQFDITTEYLDYEYLEDIEDDEVAAYGVCDEDIDLRTHDTSNNENDFNEALYETKIENTTEGKLDNLNEAASEIKITNTKEDDKSLACSKEEYSNTQTELQSLVAQQLAALEQSDEVSESMTVNSVPSKGNSHAERKVFKRSKITNDGQRKKQKVSKKSKGYLKDILRYSNATPIKCHTDSGFECSYCTQQYVNPKDLKHHTLDKHSEMLTTNTTEDHIKLDITDLKCIDCYTNINSLHDLKSHIAKEHNRQIRIMSDIPIVPFKFDAGPMKCAVCETKYINFNFLNKHMKIHFGDYKKLDTVLKEEVKCENNKNSKDSSKNMVKREAECEDNKHSEGSSKNLVNSIPEKNCNIPLEERVEDKNSQFKCTSCDSVFKNRSALLVHMNVYHLKVLVKCEYCDSKFLGKKDLERHVMVKHCGKIK